MARRGDRLPVGWERAIPDALWPDVMVSAIRYDLSAFLAPRVVDTLREWRAHANGVDLERKQQAIRRIKMVARALIDPDELELDEPTMAILFEPTQANVPTYQPPANPPKAEFADTDSSVEKFAEEVFAEEDETEALPEEATVAAFTLDQKQLDPKPRVPRSVPPPPPGPPPPPPADSQELSAIMPPDRRERPVLKPASGARRPSVPPAPLDLHASEAFNVIAEMLGEEQDPESMRTHMALAPGVKWEQSGRKPSQTSEPTQYDYQRVVSPDFKDDDDRPTTASRHPPTGPTPSSRSPVPKAPSRSQEAPRLPSEAIQTPKIQPKPGQIRRRSNPPSAARQPKLPRASMVQVRSLYNRILPLCQELAPLPPERRSRRFWAHWREVSGDQGVGADVVEALLSKAHSERTLVVELIAEVQGVDMRSVDQLVDRIEDGKMVDDADTMKPTRRAHGSLTGASVKVEGISDEEALKGD